MDLNGKLLSLLKFIDEGIRRKIYYIRYFEFIHQIFIELIENRILEIESFKRFIKATKELIWNELLRNNDFKDNFEKFLIENPEINKIIERTNMHYSIIITDLNYQFEFLDKFENLEYDVDRIEDPINNSIKDLRAELRELIKFQRSQQKEIDNIELCCICKNKTLNVCIECGECICEKHSMVGYCPNCADIILKERSKTPLK